jgi:hypothetical protein
MIGHGTATQALPGHHGLVNTTYAPPTLLTAGAEAGIRWRLVHSSQRLSLRGTPGLLARQRIECAAHCTIQGLLE